MITATGSVSDRIGAPPRPSLLSSRRGVRDDAARGQDRLFPRRAVCSTAQVERRGRSSSSRVRGGSARAACSRVHDAKGASDDVVLSKVRRPPSSRRRRRGRPARERSGAFHRSRQAQGRDRPAAAGPGDPVEPDPARNRPDPRRPAGDDSLDQEHGHAPCSGVRRRGRDRSLARPVRSQAARAQARLCRGCCGTGRPRRPGRALPEPGSDARRRSRRLARGRGRRYGEDSGHPGRRQGGNRHPRARRSAPARAPSATPTRP
jgi:hypothetical protein